MVAEVHGLLLGFDQTFALRYMLTEMIDRTVDTFSYVNSRTLFDIVVKDGTTTEKRLLIYIWSLRESY